MSSLFGGGQSKVIPEFTGLQVNTAVQVMPIPIIYGAPRCSINLIYYNGFNAQKVSTGGGKGISGGGKGGSSQVEYFATFIGALGEGPLAGVFIIYQDQNVWTVANYPSNGAFFFSGGPGQTPWSYVATLWPTDSRAYPNTSYFAFSNAQIDSSATVPQINMVPRGLLASTSPLNNDTITISTGQYDTSGKAVSFIGDIPIGNCDADPASVIYDFLTNDTYGATFPLQWLDVPTLLPSANAYDPNTGDASVSSYCQAVGLAWSLVLNNAESASSILDRWCKNIAVAPVWNGAKLRFIPYWDQYSGNNPGYFANNPLNIPLKYFQPFVQPIVTITLDQILQSEDPSEDAITFSRKDPQEVYNTVRLDFRDRHNFFNDNVVEVKDEAHIELYGPRIDNIGLANEFTLQTYANMSATLQLRRNISIMRTFTWKMGPLWAWLDPMDVLYIPDPATYSSLVLVRVVSTEDDEDENVTIVAEEFPVGAQSPTIIPMAPTTPPNQGPTNIPASSVYTPVIIEPPTALLTAQGLSTPQVMLGASGGNNSVYNGTLDPNWGGAFIWASLDNITYQRIGELRGPSIIGVLTAPLTWYGGANPDNTDILTVNFNESDSALSSVAPSVAALGTSLLVVQDASGFELLTYTTATLISPFTYHLTGLYRGAYGTTARSFGTGSRLMGVAQANNFFETSLPAAYVGKTFYIKLQSFNVFNTALQDLSTAIAYQYVAGGSSPPPPPPPPAMRDPTYRRRLFGPSNPPIVPG